MGENLKETEKRMQQQRKAEAEQHKKLMEKLLKKIDHIEKMNTTENY